MAVEMAHKGKRNEVSTYHIHYEKRELPHRQPVWPTSTKCQQSKISRNILGQEINMDQAHQNKNKSDGSKTTYNVLACWQEIPTISLQ